MKTRSRSVAGLACALLLAAASFAQEAEPPKHPRVALVLEGGGALGLAHIAVIRAIEECGIPVDAVVGTSMGALIGGFYAIGYDSAMLEDLALRIDWYDMFRERGDRKSRGMSDRDGDARFFTGLPFTRSGIDARGGLLSGRRISELLDVLTAAVPSPVDFDELPRQYRSVATDIETGRKAVALRGNVSEAMRASMNIPGMLAPYLLDGKYLVDGGLVENLPVQTARDLGAEIVIAVHLVSGGPFDPHSNKELLFSSLGRTLDILLKANIDASLSGADFVVSLDMNGYKLTDFDKAKEIIERSKTLVPSFMPELKRLKAAIGGTDGSWNAGRLPPAFKRMRFECDNENDETMVRSAFAGTDLRHPDYRALWSTVDALDRKDVFDAIRLRRESGSDGDTLLVKTERKPQAVHSADLGLAISQTYADSLTGNRSVSVGVTMRDLFADGSRLSIKAEVLDSPGIDIAYRQPIGDHFFFDAFYTKSARSDVLLSDSAISYLYQADAAICGADIGFSPFPWAETTAGMGYDWIDSVPLPNVAAGAPLEAFPILHCAFRIDTVDSRVFPTAGVLLRMDYYQALSKIGADRTFRTLAVSGLVVPAFRIPFGVTLAGELGTDFSRTGNGAEAAPLYFKPDLLNRRLFPGPLKMEERIGSHVVGGGIEAKYQLNWATRASGFPMFALAQLASGIVLQDADEIEFYETHSHWNTALGVGVRLNEGFGAEFRIGVASGFDKRVKPYLALDLGSFSF